MAGVKVRFVVSVWWEGGVGTLCPEPEGRTGLRPVRRRGRGGGQSRRGCRWGSAQTRLQWLLLQPGLWAAASQRAPGSYSADGEHQGFDGRVFSPPESSLSLAFQRNREHLRVCFTVAQASGGVEKCGGRQVPGSTFSKACVKLSLTSES